jgi:hypothetical protein
LRGYSEGPAPDACTVEVALRRSGDCSISGRADDPFRTSVVEERRNARIALEGPSGTRWINSAGTICSTTSVFPTRCNTSATPWRPLTRTTLNKPLRFSNLTISPDLGNLLGGRSVFPVTDTTAAPAPIESHLPGRINHQPLGSMMQFS